MKSLKINFTVIILILKIANVKPSPELIVTNNGPSVLDSNITFTAYLLNYEPRHQLTYVFDDGYRKAEHNIQALNVTFVSLFSSSIYEERSYFMKVTVYSENFFYKETVATNSTKFDLKRDLIGQLYVYRNLDGKIVDVDEVPVGENVSISIGLIDNNKYLENAVIDYSWSVDFEKQQTLNNTLIYNFTEPGIKDIKSAVMAVLPNNDFKYGYFERSVNAKIPVNTVNISGNPFLYHGDTLNLNVTCNGTPPFVYCYEILRNNISTANFTCTHLSSFTTCRMEIMKYFQDDGTYHIGIYISNNVREVKRVIEVMVYSVSVNPTLSIIIIPIVCALLTLIIIAMGVSYCVQQRNQMAVEVANFDFQDEGEDFQERTFFEKILDSFSCRGCQRSGETEPLVWDNSTEA